MNAFDDPEKALGDFIDRQKMKRLGTADEIAGAVSFLASKDVRFSSLFQSKCSQNAATIQSKFIQFLAVQCL